MERQKREHAKANIVVSFGEEEEKPAFLEKQREIKERLAQKASRYDASPPVKQRAQTAAERRQLAKIDNALNQNVNIAMQSCEKALKMLI